MRVFGVGREILPVSGRIALRQAKKGESEEGEEERGRGEGGTKPRRRPAADESWRPGRRAKKKTCPGLQVVRGLSSSLRCARPAVEWCLRVRTRVSCRTRMLARATADSCQRCASHKTARVHSRSGAGRGRANVEAEETSSNWPN